MDGWMGKVRLGGCGEEAVVGLRGGGKGGGIGDRGWGTGLDLQLQEAEVTRVRQLRYDAPMENIPIMEVQRSKGCTRSSALSDQFTALRLRITSVEGCSQGCTTLLILNPAEQHQHQHQHQHQPCASPIEVFSQAAAVHSSTALPSSAITPQTNAELEDGFLPPSKDPHLPLRLHLLPPRLDALPLHSPPALHLELPCLRRRHNPPSPIFAPDPVPGRCRPTTRRLQPVIRHGARQKSHNRSQGRWVREADLLEM